MKPSSLRSLAHSRMLEYAAEAVQRVALRRVCQREVTQAEDIALRIGAPRGAAERGELPVAAGFG